MREGGHQDQGWARVRQLRRELHPPVAAGPGRELPLQRLRPLPQVQRRQQADCQADPDTRGLVQAGGNVMRQLRDDHDHVVEENHVWEDCLQRVWLVPARA